MEHPGLYFEAEDIELVRESTGREELAGLWELFQETCRRDLREPIPRVADYSGWAVELQWAGALAKALEAHSFLWLLKRDVAHLQRAHELAQTLCELPVWVAECHSGGGKRRFGLTTGVICQALALYRDWAGPELSGGRYDRVLKAVQEKGLEAFWHDHELPGWFQQRTLNNWISVMCGGLGLALLSFESEHPDWERGLEACVFQNERYLRYIHPDGSLDEIGGYWLFGFGHALRFIHALKFLEEEDFFETCPQVSLTASFPGWLSYNGDFAVEFGDCNQTPLELFAPLSLGALAGYDEAPADAGQLALLAGAPDRLRPLLEVADVPFATRGRSIFEMWQAFVWAPTLRDEQPTGPPGRGRRTAVPTQSRVFGGSQVAVIASGRTADDLLLALRAGHNAQSHCHQDLNNVVLWAYGENLLADHGRGRYSHEYWRRAYGDFYKDTRGHNCILVNGRGQKRGRDCTAHLSENTVVRSEGALQRYEPGEAGGWAEYVFSEADCLYGEDEFALNVAWDRHVVMVDGEWFLIVDNVRTDMPVAFSWLWHTRGQIELGDERVTFHRGEVLLAMDFMTEEDYALEIREDQDLPYLRLDLAEEVTSAEIATVLIPASPAHAAPHFELEAEEHRAYHIETRRGRYVLDVAGRGLWLE